MDGVEIISKLKKADLLGRGGANFPTWQKWQMVKEAEGFKKYVICNASEGEPGVKKDYHLLINYPEKVIAGIKFALITIPNSTAYIYLNVEYYGKFKRDLLDIIDNLPIKIFKKTGHYIGGEETALLETIEGKRQQPRLKPPYPTSVGLFGLPTLINNVETFYFANQIIFGEYRKTRLYTLSGDIKNKGVFEFPLDLSIKQILIKTDNLPKEDFFVQAGGGAEGEILLPEELKQPVPGTGAIIVFNRAKTNPYKLMANWAKFLIFGNCDKCPPCREGIYRINQMIENKTIDKKIMADIFYVLENTSFCGLGRGAALPFKSLIKKLGL